MTNFTTKLLSVLCLLCLCHVSAQAEAVTDVITAAKLAATSTSYTDFSGVQITSTAVYAGNTASTDGTVQLRSKNNNSGIVTTTSGGTIKKVSVAWNAKTVDGRVVEVYGSNTAYASAADLYDDAKKGTLLGSFEAKTDGTLTIEGDYKYVALRSKADAMYFDNITLEWDGEKGQGGGDNNDTKPATPVASVPAGYYANSVTVTLTAAEGLSILYTLEDEGEMVPYTGAITITSESGTVTKTLRAVAKDSQGNLSDELSVKYSVIHKAGMTVPEGCVGFDFAMNPWNYTLGTGSGATASAGDLTAPIVQDGVTLSYDNSGASTPARMWSYNAGGQLRVFKGGTMTLTAPEGYVITKISVTQDQGAYTVSTGTLSGNDWTGEAESVTYTITTNARFNTILVELLSQSGTTVKAPVITPGTGTYTEAQTVSIQVAEGLTAYYTIDGTTKQYTEPFTVSETTTIEAYAQDSEGNKSAKVTAVITIESLPTYTTIAGLKTGATKDKVQSAFKFENLLVTGVSGNSTYVTDGQEGFLFYTKSNFKKGDILSGTVTGQLYLYSGLTEMASIDYSGVTVVSSGNTVTPKTVTIADITNGAGVKDNENLYVRLENVMFEAASLTSRNVNLLDNDDNSVVLRDNFNVLTNETFDTQKEYNVNAYVAQYNGTVQLYVIDADELEIISNLKPSGLAWANDTIVVLPYDSRAVVNSISATSDGAVTYTSSDTNVATIDAQGQIKLTGYGVALITAESAETETYLAGKAVFTLAVIEGQGTLASPYTVADAKFYNGQIADPVWVKGTYVGYVDGNSLSGAVIGADGNSLEEGSVKTNLLLAGIPAGTSIEGLSGNACLPVQLPANTDVRPALQISNANAYLKEICLLGTLEKYFSAAGLKNVTKYSLDGQTVSAIQSVTSGEAAMQEYNLLGQKVGAAKRGIVIKGGKKVYVK